MVEEIRVTGLATSLVLATAEHDLVAVGKALDHALRHGTSPGWIAKVATRWRGRGVPGSGVLLDMLAERVGRNLPRSWFERMAGAALANAGVTLVHEHPVEVGGRKMVIDLAAPELLVGIECQSTRWHASPSARQADLRRKRALRAAGWQIVEVWWSDLQRFDEVLADVLIAIDRQRSLLSARSGRPAW